MPKINENALAQYICQRVRTHLGKDGLDLSIAQVKMVQRELLHKLGGYRMSEVVELVERHFGLET